MNWISDHFRISYATAALIIAEVGGLRLILIIYIGTHTNGVQGLCCKLQTEFFPVDLWPNCKACISHKSRGKNKDLAYGLVSELRRHIT